MRKSLFLVMFLPLMLGAEVLDRTGPYLAAGGGYATFKDKGRLEGTLNSTQNGFITGGAFINKYLSVELMVDYFDTVTTQNKENTTDLYFFCIDTKAHYPFWKDRIDLFGSFGAGGVSWKETLNGVSQKEKSSALMGEAGVGVRVVEDVTLNVGYRRYFFTLVQNDLTGHIEKQYKMEMSSLYASVEVQF